MKASTSSSAPRRLGKKITINATLSRHADLVTSTTLLRPSATSSPSSASRHRLNLLSPAFRTFGIVGQRRSFATTETRLEQQLGEPESLLKDRLEPSAPLSTDLGGREARRRRKERKIEERKERLTRHGNNFPPGTIVSFTAHPSSPPALGVVLDTVLLESKIKLRVLSLSGSILYPSPQSVIYAFTSPPSLIPSTLVSQCGSEDVIGVSNESDEEGGGAGGARSRALMYLRKLVNDVEVEEMEMIGGLERVWEGIRSAEAREEGGKGYVGRRERLFLEREEVVEWVREEVWGPELDEEDGGWEVVMPGEKKSSTKKETGEPVGRDRWKGQEERIDDIHGFVTQRFMLSRSERFVAMPNGGSHWSVGGWKLKSQEEVEAFEIVREWIREDHPNIASFVKTAQTLIDHSRPSLFAPPPSTPSDPIILPPSSSPSPTFTSSDLLILAHISSSLSPLYLAQSPPYSSTVPTLLKKIARYGDRVGVGEEGQAVAQMLVECGVRVGWDDWAVRTSPLGLEGETAGFASGKKAAENSTASIVKEEATSSSSAFATIPSTPSNKTSEPSSSTFRPTSSLKLGPDEFYPSDLCAPIRHDFGSLPVYVIDDPTASELDDGISIAPHPDPSKSHLFWVHIHIADPTTLLHPQHRLSLAAQRRGSTVYLPQGNFPLLPNELTVDRFSLGRAGRLKGGEGQECLTFSALVDKRTGEVEDYEIRAGWVRNIVVTTYAAVNEVLRSAAASSSSPSSPPPSSSPSTEYPLGMSQYALQASIPSSSSSDTLTDPAHISDLLSLDSIAHSIRRKRLRAGSLSFSLPSFSIAVHPRPLPTLPQSPSVFSSSPQFTSGSPTIDYAVHSPSNASSVPAQNLVATCMTLAGSLAARFFSERSLSAPYRTFSPPLAPSRDALGELKSLRDPITGDVDQADVLRLGIVFRRGELSMTPGGHFAMGIQANEGGYVRVTSPLRRYTDILSHWQIKHALLAEHESKSEPSPLPSVLGVPPLSSLLPTSARRSSPSLRPLFDLPAMSSRAHASESAADLVKNLQKASLNYWAVSALFNHSRSLAAATEPDPFLPSSDASSFLPLLNPSPSISSASSPTWAPHPLPPYTPLGRYDAMARSASRPSPTTPGKSSTQVFVPDLALQFWVEHDSKEHIFEPADPLEVLIDQFLIGPRSEVRGIVASS